MNIILLGFMGTGKTVVGKLLAEKLKLSYVDIDREIEKEEKTTISRIFSQSGEKYFRSLEKRAVLKISQRQNQVVSAGGGVVLDSDNIKNLEKHGILFCLNASPDIILKRTGGFIHRPLLQVANPKSAIEELLRKRRKYYQRIKNHIDTSDLTAEEVSEEIIRKYRKTKDDDAKD